MAQKPGGWLFSYLAVYFVEQSQTVQVLILSQFIPYKDAVEAGD